jgi:uncharacterized protein YdeI (YjbR/CyaY-like superfamily)
MDEFAQIEFTSRNQLRQWLLAHHLQSAGIWAVTFKKGTGEGYVSRDDILNEVLCFGWIDGARKKLDDMRTMQRLSPRKTHSWARTYQVRAQSLIDESLMHKSGLQAITTAKELGLWNELDHVDDLAIPDDLTCAFARHEMSQKVFEALAPSYQRNVLRWIAKAKTTMTRQDRIDTTARATAHGERINHL